MEVEKIKKWFKFNEKEALGIFLTVFITFLAKTENIINALIGGVVVFILSVIIISLFRNYKWSIPKTILIILFVLLIPSLLKFASFSSNPKDYLECLLTVIFGLWFLFAVSSLIKIICVVIFVIIFIVLKFLFNLKGATTLIYTILLSLLILLNAVMLMEKCSEMITGWQ